MTKRHSLAPLGRENRFPIVFHTQNDPALRRRFVQALSSLPTSDLRSQVASPETVHVGGRIN